MKKGFTLIELLVVVLIIGILAAAALPQYEMAMEKARATEGILLMKFIAQSVQRYHMENKDFPANFDALDITVPTTTDSAGNTYIGTKNYKITGSKYTTNCGHDYTINLTEVNPDFQYVLSTHIKQDGTIKRYCTKGGTVVATGCFPVMVEPASARGKKFCTALTGGHSIDGEW